MFNKSDNNTSVNSKKILYLVDVSGFFFRAYYAISHRLKSPTGLPTNALYGLLSMTYKFIKENKPEYMVYCFDHKAPSFRVDIYKEYKANRVAIPEELKIQIPYVKKLVTAMGIPTVEQAGYEADDIIGTLATQQVIQKNDFKVVIVSGDKDFAQLVCPAVSLYDPTKSCYYDTLGVQQKWGVLPHQINDYLAIIGDASDNIPGVFGIGPKGAQKLLQEYKNLEQIYQNINNISTNTSVKLINSKDKAFLSQKLARIVTDINFKSPLPDFKFLSLQTVELQKLLQELGFKTLEKKLYSINNTQSSNKNVTSKSPVKTHKVKKLPSNLRCHIFTWEELKTLIEPYGKVWFFLKDEQYFLAYKNKVIDLKNHNLFKIGKLFSERRIIWHGYNLKKIWKDFNCTHPRPYWCAMMAAYLIESKSPGSFDNIIFKYLGSNITAELAPGEVYLLHKRLKKELESQLTTLNMLELYNTIELPLISVLYEIENKGIMLNLEELKQQSLQVDQKIIYLKQQIFKYVKYEFNISSTKQLAEVLFKELKLQPIKKNKTGYSTDVSVLNKLKNQHNVIPLIIEYRELFKLKTTYIDALSRLKDVKTNRVHTNFQQALTATGRLSTINPNLQNIPIKTQQGRNIRKVFIAPEGKKIISADYSQIELRILAHMSDDPALCSAFQQNLDIHTATASQIYSVPIKDVTENLRRLAKTINFGLIYGQGAYTLSESLGVSVSEAKDIIKNYFTRFKKVKEYMESVVKSAYQKGFVETCLGRKRTITELTSSRVQIKQQGERVAINTPIQGTASDLVKQVMINLRNSLYSPMLLQIHDELLFECEDHLLEEEIKKIRDIMENSVHWKVPLKVNIYVGQSWYEAHG